jgi:dimethylhistidine N-methyltransferase
MDVHSEIVMNPITSKYARAGIIDAVEPEAAATQDFAADVISGLSARHKQLPPKYFYDATGSHLFEEICRTDEYYVTRSETILLRNVAAEVAADIPNGAALVEFGSGESAKTRLLLDAAPQLSTYVPIDISADALCEASGRLGQDYPQLSLAPVVADFTGHFRLPRDADGCPRVGFFPGSTIGNFDRDGAVRFLRLVREVLGIHAALLVGVDLIKDPATLVAAYDDSRGVTARFNKNLRRGSIANSMVILTCALLITWRYGTQCTTAWKCIWLAVRTRSSTPRAILLRSGGESACTRRTRTSSPWRCLPGSPRKRVGL